MRVIKNLPASVRSQLMNHAKQQGKPFNEILQHYALIIIIGYQLD